MYIYIYIDQDPNNDGDDDDDEEKSNTKYRDVRDIFGDVSSGTAVGGGESRLRLNRDALVASRKAGLRSTYTAP